MTNREKFLAGAIFRLNGETYRFLARNGEFADNVIQLNASLISYDFKDYCHVLEVAEYRVFFFITIFGEPHYFTLPFKKMVFAQESTES